MDATHGEHPGTVAGAEGSLGVPPPKHLTVPWFRGALPGRGSCLLCNPPGSGFPEATCGSQAVPSKALLYPELSQTTPCWDVGLSRRRKEASGLTKPAPDQCFFIANTGTTQCWPPSYHHRLATSWL